MRCALVARSRELVVAAGFLGGYYALLAPRPRNLRLIATPSRKGRGAHVVLEPPLVFRLTSATSATSLWTRVALSGLLLGRASTCSFEVVQIGLTFQRILGSRVFCFCFVSRRAYFSIFLEPKLCSCAAACSSFITCCGSRRRSGSVSYKFPPLSPILRDFGPVRECRSDFAIFKGFLQRTPPSHEWASTRTWMRDPPRKKLSR